MAKTQTYLLLKQYARDNLFDGETVKDDRIIARACADGLRKLAGERVWSFNKTRYRVTTTVPYTTGTVSVNHGSTTVTGSGTTFTAAMVGRFIYLNGESVPYEIASRASNTSIELASAYVNASGSNLSGATYSIVAQAYALPPNFRALERINDVRRLSMPAPLGFNDLLDLYNQQSGSGSPIYYAVDEVAGAVLASSQRQLWLWPAPALVYQYDLIYSRWPEQPSLDADIIDWPDNHLDALRAAVMWCLARESKNGEWTQSAMMAYSVELAASMKADQVDARPAFMGMPDGDEPQAGRYGYPSIVTPV